MQTILVTGATGNVGRHLVAQLCAANVRVRALARNPETAALPALVEVVRGDLTDPATLDTCAAGVDAIFLMWQAPPATIVPALERITKHSPRIVFLSNLSVRDGVEQQQNPISTLHATIEHLIEASGVPWTFLRPGAFANNASLWWRAQIRTGNVVRWPCAGALTAPIHERDIAAVAVLALCNEGHAGAKYILTGPQSLSHRDQVRILAEALGRPLRFDEIPPESAHTELTNIMHMPDFIADILLNAWNDPEYGAAYIRGQTALVTSTVAEITGAPPHSFHDWAIDHAADFQATSFK